MTPEQIEMIKSIAKEMSQDPKLKKMIWDLIKESSSYKSETSMSEKELESIYQQALELAKTL
jgi:hypothetical protein